MFIIQEESSYQKLFSKGFGSKTGEYFLLNAYEAMYLLETGKIKIRNSRKEVLTEEYFIEKKVIDYNLYIVFRDLRSKGYIVKSGIKYGFIFRVYDKGVKLGQEHSKYLVEVYKENESMKIRDFSAKSRVSHSTRKNILFAVIDCENSITYFETNWKRIL